MAKKRKESTWPNGQDTKPHVGSRISLLLTRCLTGTFMLAISIFGYRYLTEGGSAESTAAARESQEAADQLRAHRSRSLQLVVQGVYSPEEPLRRADVGLIDLMQYLKGDRFSENSGIVLHQREHLPGPQRFAVRSLLVFWYLHRNQLIDAKLRLDAILKDKDSPSDVAEHIILLWRSVIHHMQEQESYPMGRERLQEEREAFAELRRSMTLRERHDKNWLWLDLFNTEATWLIGQLPSHNSKDNSKCLYVPGLLAKEYYPASIFAEAQLLEDNYEDIMKEITPFLEHANFNQVGGATSHDDAKLVSRGTWTDVSLFSAGAKNEDACRKLLKLCSLLEREAPEVARNVQGHALLSRMDSGTVIKRHHGSSNSQLTMHLGLLVPRGDLGLEVNKKKERWKQGKVLVFDDSFYHSVYNKGNGPRLVLLLRGYHPEWTLEERAGLIMHHNETPWTREDRLAEVEHLSTPLAQKRWEARKRLFQQGADLPRSHQEL